MLDAPIIELDIIDSTNNYAMRLIDADTTQPGLTIAAKQQTQGKGQRGKVWNDEPGESILMSIILAPDTTLDMQFVFSSAVAVAVADVLSALFEGWDVCIKWPNDIIINDKKAGGILIENVIRAAKWTHAVVGIGLNVRQQRFPEELPLATSLAIASGKMFETDVLLGAIRQRVIEYTSRPMLNESMLKRFNEYLYRKGQPQKFTDNKTEWHALILETVKDGTIRVQTEKGAIVHYTHGEVIWKW